MRQYYYNSIQFELLTILHELSNSPTPIDLAYEYNSRGHIGGTPRPSQMTLEKLELEMRNFISDGLAVADTKQVFPGYYRITEQGIIKFRELNK